MKGFVSLSRAMWRGFVRDRGALVFTIALPVMFLLLFGSIYKNPSAPKLNLAVVGPVPLLTEARAHDPAAFDRIVKLTPVTSKSKALSDVSAGTYDATVMQDGNALIVRYSIADLTKAGIVNSVLSSIVQQANQSGAAPRYSVSFRQVENGALKPIQYITPGLLGWALASGATFGAAITLVTWRQTKLLRRIRLAPIGTPAVVTARVGIAVAIGLVQVAAFLLIARLPYFGLTLSSSWWMSIPLVVCGILAFMSIGLLVGAFAKTQQAATAIANMIILPMAFLGGAFLPLDFAPSWIRAVSHVMPLSYLVTGMQDVMARGNGPAAALPAIGVLLGFTIVISAIAIRVFRWDDV